MEPIHTQRSQVKKETSQICASTSGLTGAIIENKDSFLLSTKKYLEEFLDLQKEKEMKWLSEYYMPMTT